MQWSREKSVLLCGLSVLLTIWAMALPAQANAVVDDHVQYPGYLRDLSVFCGQNPTMPPGQMMPPPPGLDALAGPLRVGGTDFVTTSPDPNQTITTADWAFLPSSSMVIYGTAAGIRVTSGEIAVVSCSGDLIIDATPNDTQRSQLPVGIGALVNATNTNGVYISLSEMNGQVRIVQLDYGDNSTADATIDIQSDGTTPLTCDAFDCWSGEEAEPVEGGGPCGGVRCWSK